MKSEVAKCAGEIRKILKAKNIKASVRSSRFSGTSSVTVHIKEIINQERLKALKYELGKYKYGQFDGMSDSYDTCNIRKDLPQTGYLSITMVNDGLVIYRFGE